MFGSTWGNQNQQQQQPNAFGQPSTFGGNTTTSAFGSTAFGQPQQPQANPMFGNVGGTSTTTPSGGFGAFGSSNTGSTSAFGAPKPATGFGAFSGSTGAFGSGGGAFGQATNPTTTSTNVFGQPSTSNTTTFGSSSLFGGTKPATTAFGTTNVSTVNNGTAGTPYSVLHEKDPNAAVTLQYQTITCMQAYRGYSLEELRMQDYTQNRKTASTTGFGGSAFSNTQPTSTGIFGSQPNQPAQTSIFGGGTTNPNPPGGFGAFGQTNQANATQPNTGIFGGSTFGQQTQQQQQQQQQQQPNTFGTFGQQNQQQPQQPSSIFGGNSAFGSNTSKPAFGSTFGNAGATTGTFGGTGFGQNPQPQQQTNTLFGGTQPAANPAFGSFGNANNQNKSIFGSGTTTQPTTTTPGYGLFGNQNQPNQQGQQQQQQQQPAQQTSIFGTPGGGLFGNTNTGQQPQQNPTQPTSLFGGNQTNTGTGLFGNPGGLFGNTNNQQQQQAGTQQPGQTNTFGSIFGPKPAGTTPSLFSGVGQQGNLNNTTTQPQTSIFGNNQGTNQQLTLGGGLFGPKPAAPALGTSTSGQTGGLFGSTLGVPNNMLNTSTVLPGSQQSLTASIAEPIGANLPIFSMLPPGPRSVNLEQSQPKKKAGFFVDIPTRSPVPRVQLGYTPANSKLRGFGASTTASVNGGNPFVSLGFTSGKPNALSLAKSTEGHGPIGSDGAVVRSASPALGSGPRQSVKKVILDKKIEPSELFIKSGSPGSLRGGKITFSPALSVAVREKDAAAAAASSSSSIPQLDSPTPVSKNPSRSPNRFTANSVADAAQNSTTEATADTTLREGDYYVKPDLATLKKASYDQLSSYEELVVGRVGYGEIHFLEPVDLTGLSKLGALLGEVIRFDDKECSVYPDSEDVDKPPPGSGLNVKARLILERCWATDKATREPIKDASHPTAAKHLKRLKSMKDTHFENFEMDSGKWTFTVDHF